MLVPQVHILGWLKNYYTIKSRCTMLIDRPQYIFSLCTPPPPPPSQTLYQMVLARESTPLPTTTPFLLHLTVQLFRSVQYLAAQLFRSAPTQRILETQPFVILAVVYVTTLSLSQLFRSLIVFRPAQLQYGSWILSTLGFFKSALHNCCSLLGGWFIHSGTPAVYQFSAAVYLFSAAVYLFSAAVYRFNGAV